MVDGHAEMVKLENLWSCYWHLKWQPPAVRELAAMLDCVLWQWEYILTPPDRASHYDRVQEAACGA